MNFYNDVFSQSHLLPYCLTYSRCSLGSTTELYLVHRLVKYDVHHDLPTYGTAPAQPTGPVKEMLVSTENSSTPGEGGGSRLLTLYCLYWAAWGGGGEGADFWLGWRRNRLLHQGWYMLWKNKVVASAAAALQAIAGPLAGMEYGTIWRSFLGNVRSSRHLDKGCLLPRNGGGSWWPLCLQGTNLPGWDGIHCHIQDFHQMQVQGWNTHMLKSPLEVHLHPATKGKIGRGEFADLFSLLFQGPEP